MDIDRALRESEQWLAITLKSISDAVITTDRQGKIQLMNAVAERLTGWTFEAARGQSVNDIVRVIDQTGREFQFGLTGQNLHDEAMVAGTSALKLLSKERLQRPVDISVSSIRDAQGQAMGMVLVVRDLTERKRAEAALEEEHNLLRTLIDAFPDSIYVKDTQSRFMIGNQALASRMGARTPGALIGKTDFDFYPQAFAEKFYADEQHVLQTNQPLINKEEPSIDAAGNPRWLLTTKVPLYNRQGQIIGLVGTGRDITGRKKQQAERERMEARMREFQKLESIGALAAGIAHDFNNMLMGIQGSVELALMNLRAPSVINQYLHDIKTACQRAAGLIQQLLAYAGKGTYQIEPVNLSALITEMTQLIKPLISKKADLRLSLDETLPPVEGDATQIRQIVMNLILNASEALGDTKGVVQVETGVVMVDQHYVTSSYRHEPLPTGQYGYVRVSDSGCGMDAETKARIFEPFFTTKFMGRGLGLSVVLGIVRNHGGDIYVESEPGKGTRFQVLLPCHKTI